jgi:hypothetical protein
VGVSAGNRRLYPEMPELFPDFISNRESFEKAKAFWGLLASEEAAKLNQDGEWLPWFQNEEWRADPELMDGAVVFSLYSACQNKGLRVQQSACCVSREKSPFVASFTDMFGEGCLDRPIPNLFIGTIPTDENLPLLRRIVCRWFDKRVDQEAMETFVDSEVYEQKG